MDGKFVQAPNFKECTGYSVKRTGTNVSVLTERDGLPLTGDMAKGNRNDITTAELTLQKLQVGVKRQVHELNADKGYDSKAFQKYLRKRGTGTNIPERKAKHRRKRGRKPHMDKMQFKFRAFVEWTNAWLKSYWKLRYRYERKKCIFQVMVDSPVCLLICEE